MAAKLTLVLPYWAILLAFLACTETAIVVDKSVSLTPAIGKNRIGGTGIDDKGSSSASEDFIDLDASPSHVLHEVDGYGSSKESEIGDTHDSMPLQRPKTTIEVDSDENDDVIHSGSGDDLETLELDKNVDKGVRIHGRAEALTSNTNITTNMAYPSSTQANYNPSTSTTTTSETYTTTQSVRLSTTSNTTRLSSANISGTTTTLSPKEVLPASSEESSSVLSDEEESSGSGSGFREIVCNEYNCKYGGVCDFDSEGPSCICYFDCKKESSSPDQKPGHSVCGSDGVLYSNSCYMKKTSCVQQRRIVQKPRSFCVKQKQTKENHTNQGSGCNEHNCKYGGVCKSEPEGTACVCYNHCKKESASSGQKLPADRSVCGSDGVLYSNTCYMRMTSCVQQVQIDQKPRSFCVKQKPLAMNCTEHETTATWTAWSPWIQSGDVDIRFRSCNVTLGAGQNATNVTCHGERMQTRSCPVTETKTCATSNGTNAVSMTYQCKGINPMDTHMKDAAFLQYPDEGKCRFSLYDVGYEGYKYLDWTYAELREKGEVEQWCAGPLDSSDNYRLRYRKRWSNNLIVMHTPLRACRVKLDKFCRESIPPCRYTNRNSKRWAKNNNNTDCFHDSLLSGDVPTGIPNQEGGQTFLCQRFSPNTVYGKMFDTKQSHYLTLYDTTRRAPVYSASKLTIIENNGWPRTPFMVDRNLIDKQTQSSWFYMIKNKRKGLAAVSELEKEIRYDQCAVGKYQATPSDYEYTNYRIGQLLPFHLVGHRVDDHIASFAMTNVVPMHRDFYVEWKRVTQIIYKYALEVCRVPRLHEVYEYDAAARRAGQMTSTTAFTSTAAPSLSATTPEASSTAPPSSDTTTESSSLDEDRKYGQLYLVAGAVPTMGKEKTVGNGVNVPHLIWMAGCCIRGKETKGFAVYGQNTAQSTMGATSLPQLEILLSQEYTKHTERSHPFKIKIFPGLQGRCSSAQNDDSLNLAL